MVTVSYSDIQTFFTNTYNRLKSIPTTIDIATADTQIAIQANIETTIWGNLHGEVEMDSTDITNLKELLKNSELSSQIERAYRLNMALMGRPSDEPISSSTKIAFIIQLMCSSAPDYLNQSYSDDELKSMVSSNCGTKQGTFDISKHIEKPVRGKALPGTMITAYNPSGTSVMQKPLFPKGGKCKKNVKKTKKSKRVGNKTHKSK